MSRDKGVARLEEERAKQGHCVTGNCKGLACDCECYACLKAWWSGRLALEVAKAPSPLADPPGEPVDAWVVDSFGDLCPLPEEIPLAERRRAPSRMREHLAIDAVIAAFERAEPGTREVVAVTYPTADGAWMTAIYGSDGQVKERVRRKKP